ncbi:hypothetical protein VK70_09715 [Paenibacillus durus ATCC 35681]|uniref:Cyclophilin-like domain-containing protein n=2 Tax=Paenibacillus durus TaxID=44251 RepID=A0A0F7FGD4_PAEDU|nr:hypothetical protein VK70_09715 [Paenibacillus durus ATCC 35681]
MTGCTQSVPSETEQLNSEMPENTARPSTQGNERTETEEVPQEQSNSRSIKMTLEGEEMTATLFDNATARDFISMLPVTLTFEDFAGSEKIAYPPRTLTTQNVSDRHAVETGDITVYVPWGNIAVFYRGGGEPSSDLIHIGKMDGNGIDRLAAMDGSFSATFERFSEIKRSF